MGLVFILPVRHDQIVDDLVNVRPVGISDISASPREAFAEEAAGQHDVLTVRGPTRVAGEVTEALRA